MVEHTQGIMTIRMKPEAVCFCPLGNDWYKNKFDVTIQPGKVIPDYCEVEKWLDEHIRGQKLIIEDAVKGFYNYINKTYEPNFLQVTSHVDDAAHFPVVVTK